MATWTTEQALTGLGGERLRQRVAAHIEQREKNGGIEYSCAVRGVQVRGEFPSNRIVAAPQQNEPTAHEQAENARWLEHFHQSQRDFERQRLRLELLRRLG